MSTEDRKSDHLTLANQSQTEATTADSRFYYEPMLGVHPSSDDRWPVDVGDKTLDYPIWISSMTGGTGAAGPINKNLAAVCKSYGLGMGLGSCRILMDSDEHLSDFNCREIIGPDLPLYANLGIAQLETIVRDSRWSDLERLIVMLRADGLIIHVNPLQEWFQEEGDRISIAPIELVRRLLDWASFPVMVKEVGQGMGPESLRALLDLPLESVEFGAYGGTNFSKLEALRRSSRIPTDQFDLIKVGHTAAEMMQYVRDIHASGAVNIKSVIASGGVQGFMDGYHLIHGCPIPAMYGQASMMLRYAAESYEALDEYVAGQIQGLLLAKNLLRSRT